MHVACKAVLKLDRSGWSEMHSRWTQKGQIKHVSQTENCQLKMISESQGYFEVRPTTALFQYKSDEES